MAQDKKTAKQRGPLTIPLTRRTFLKYTGIAVVGIYTAGCENVQGKVKPSAGYLLVDMNKCQGCTTCMLACSLVHEGFCSHSLARIQIVQDSFSACPDDITIAQCRQCVEPACLEACPTGALHADRKNGYVRTIDRARCIGCKACVAACPYPPARSIWNSEEHYAQKCDLCADTPFWDEVGGPSGKQACIEFCPMQAIQFSSQIPDQDAEDGYNVDLRDETWEALGFSTE